MEQKEIKFRAWDGVDYMSKPYSLIEIQAGKIQFTKESKIMQFTGLHDKNGKEIYEGDYLFTRDGVCFVVWDSYMWMVESPGSEARDEMYESDYKESEIIGNIYENPELTQHLTKPKDK